MDVLSYNARTLKPDDLIGNYHLMGMLGAGGMGEVWKAEDMQLRRMVALKFLPSSYAQDSEALARMRREARTAAQLYHPNIATIHEIDEVDGRLFIVMEYVEGEPLSHLIRRGPLPEAVVCRIGREIAEALEEAHRRGIIHRDIKPDNVIVTNSSVKVLDFGLARRFGRDATILTQQGTVLGTFLYMSPEQAVADPLDGRTDLFSLGIVLYEMATGRVPFEGDTPSAALTKILLQDPPVPEGVSPGLRDIIMRTLQKQRDQRFATAGELVQALDRQLANVHTVITAPQSAPAPTRHGRGPLLAVATMVVAIAAATGAYLLTRPKTKPPESKPTAPAASTLTVTAPPTETVTPQTASAETATEPEVVEEETATETAAGAQLREGLALILKERTRAGRRLVLAALEQRTSLSEDEQLVADTAIAVLDEEDERAEELMEKYAEIEGFDEEYELFRRILDERAQQLVNPRRIGRAVRP